MLPALCVCSLLCVSAPCSVCVLPALCVSAPCSLCVLPALCVCSLLCVCAQPLLVPPGAQGVFSEGEEGAGGWGRGACRALTKLQAQASPVEA